MINSSTYPLERDFNSVDSAIHPLNIRGVMCKGYRARAKEG